MLSLLIGALILSGCGARTTGLDGSSDTLASRTVIKAAANCNSFSASSTKLTGKLQVYINPLGQPVTDLIRLKITGINSTFDTNTKYALKMFRWKAYSSGGTDLDQNPVTFSIWYNGQQISNYLTAVTVTELKALQQKYFISATTSSEFFSKTEILVNGLDLSWDVLKVVLYENVSATESTVIGNVDTLIPAFSANPNDYASDHPAVLSRLHPFYYDRADSMDFGAAAQSFCF
jgi:hypothetical protein